MRRLLILMIFALGYASARADSLTLWTGMLAAYKQQPIGAIDYQAALTTTPYLAFSSITTTAQRPAVDIGTAVSNTAAVWVVVLPSTASAPANLAAIQSNPTSYVLNPGDRLIGGADTGMPSNIYVASASSTQACTMQGKSLAASVTTVLRYSSTSGGATSVTVSNFPSTQPVSGTVTATVLTQGSLTDGSGTITTGGTAQTVFASNSSRKYLLIVNNSTTDILWINFTTTAVTAQPSIPIYPGGGSFLMQTTYVSTEAVSIIGATTGDSYSAKQG